MNDSINIYDLLDSPNRKVSFEKLLEQYVMDDRYYFSEMIQEWLYDVLRYKYNLGSGQKYFNMILRIKERARLLSCSDTYMDYMSVSREKGREFDIAQVKDRLFAIYNINIVDDVLNDQELTPLYIAKNATDFMKKYAATEEAKGEIDAI